MRRSTAGLVGEGFWMFCWMARIQLFRIPGVMALQRSSPVGDISIGILSTASERENIFLVPGTHLTQNIRKSIPGAMHGKCKLHEQSSRRQDPYAHIRQHAMRSNNLCPSKHLTQNISMFSERLVNVYPFHISFIALYGKPTRI